MFPEIKHHLINVFERYRYVLDSELQQRACEYYAIATREDDDELLQAICEEMPPFPPRESALLSRLNRKHGDTNDKRVWVIGGKEANADREAVRRKSLLVKTETGADGTAPSGAEDIMASLAGLDLSAPAPTEGDSSGNPIAPVPVEPPKPKSKAPVINITPDVDRWFEKLGYSGEGVLYEDVQIQMGVKSEFHGHVGRLALYVGNKGTVNLTSFSASIYTDEPDAISVAFGKMPASVISPRTQSQHLLHVECKQAFTAPPILQVSYLAGSMQTVAVRLPIVMTKFVEGVKLGQADFFERWKLIGGAPREAQNVFPINLDASGQVDIAKNRRVVGGHRFSVLEDIDPNPVNVVAAGVFHTSASGKVGCLLRLEPNKDAKVSMSHNHSGLNVLHAFVYFSSAASPSGVRRKMLQRRCSQYYKNL